MGDLQTRNHLSDILGYMGEGGSRRQGRDAQQPLQAGGVLGGNGTARGAAQGPISDPASNPASDPAPLNNAATNRSSENRNPSPPRPHERLNLSSMLPEALRNVMGPGLLNTFERFTQGEG